MRLPVFSLKSQYKKSAASKRRTFILEAPPGIEPGMKVLQTSALPLGYGAIAISLMRDSFYIIHKNTVFGNTFLKFFAGSYIFEIFCRFCKLPAGACIPVPGRPCRSHRPGKGARRGGQTAPAGAPDERRQKRGPVGQPAARLRATADLKRQSERPARHSALGQHLRPPDHRQIIPFGDQIFLHKFLQNI